ncbi:hypothetical protein ACFO3D_06575 [Virgibacillus kekensis]|uniref:Uncharacterized protein n=1 Tax=Virgibacillus kekensis TaxID=202261 RepID=A0ABV9DHV3_9BACI
MKLSRKEIQRTRMWGYFLDAATEVIEKEGIDHVTILIDIRKAINIQDSN